MQGLRLGLHGAYRRAVLNGLRRDQPHRGIQRFMPEKNESRKSLTKIVATIGPASEQFEPLQKCVSSGMRIMRLNFSHATFEEATLRIKNLRKSAGVHSSKIGGQFNLRAVLLDIQGPKIRTGSFVNGAIDIVEGESYVLTNDPEWKLKGDDKKFYVDYHGLLTYSKPGHPVMVDDGNIVMKVTQVDKDGITVVAVNSGRIKNRRGVNLPDAIVDLPALSDKDKTDLRFGVQNDIDFVAASFVRKAADIAEIRAYLAELMKEYWPEGHPAPKIIAKIESTEGLKNFEEILKVTDGIMVARGDLGVEIPVESVTNMQKMMVRKCKLAGKPVIVATQMLESMQVLPRPTRAEVSDVTHAVYDGADAVMLSGESAQGKYPVESVATMRAIIEAAETWQNHNSKILGNNLFDILCAEQASKHSDEGDSFYEASASSAVMAAQRLKAKCIIVHTETGEVARTVSKYCPSVPILCFTNSQKVARQLIIHRGVHPVVIEDGHRWEVNRDTVMSTVKKLNLCQPGDVVVVITGEIPSKEATKCLGSYFMHVGP